MVVRELRVLLPDKFFGLRMRQHGVFHRIGNREIAAEILNVRSVALPKHEKDPTVPQNWPANARRTKELVVLNLSQVPHVVLAELLIGFPNHLPPGRDERKASHL